jgi:hypothetical protein
MWTRVVNASVESSARGRRGPFETRLDRRQIETRDLRERRLR